MRVLIGISCLLTGGTEVQTLSLVEALVAAGHEVAVACYFEWDAGMKSRYERAGARVYLLGDKRAGGNAARPTGALRTMRYLLRGLRRAVRDFRPDAAHVQYMAPGAMAVMALRLLGVKRILATTHTAADIYPDKRLIHYLVRNVLCGFQCITLRAERSYFELPGGGWARGCGEREHIFDAASERLGHGSHFTIYNSLPGNIRIADTPRSGSPLTVGVLSRLEGIKGMDLVVPAFASLKARHPEARLIVGGDGSLREEMERQAREAGIDAEFLGRVTSDEVESVYDRIDVLLMPSRSEGFGLTAIEGMARGCVPVVSDTGGLPEVVENDVSGLLHRAPGEEVAEEIGDIVCRLFDRPEEWRRLSAGAIRRAARFSPEVYRHQIRALYEKVKR